MYSQLSTTETVQLELVNSNSILSTVGEYIVISMPWLLARLQLVRHYLSIEQGQRSVNEIIGIYQFIIVSTYSQDIFRLNHLVLHQLLVTNWNTH